MRLDLSSHITLERVPKRYYRPENDFEEYNLARYEKLPVEIYEDSREAAKKVANEIVEEMLKKQQKGEHFVLGISGGASPLPVYEELVRLHKEKTSVLKSYCI